MSNGNEVNLEELVRQKCRANVEALHAAAVASVGAVLGASAPACAILRHIPSCIGFAIAWAVEKLILEKARDKALTKCDAISPLVLDLDGDGVEAGAVALFDHGGDGFAEATRWAGADDGVLVWDRNGNGKIDDGGELFGNNTALANGQKAVHGFAALSELDANNDGVVDSADANFANLRVLRWTDANNNGAMDAGEERLETLSAVGVRSLKTAFVASDKVDAVGNEHRQVGSFVKADGTTAEMTDVWFVTSPEMATYSRAGIPAHSESIKGLPELAGQGRLYSLRDAMALDAAGRLTAPFYGNTRTETRTLEQLVSAFGASGMSSDKSGREALAEKILLRWAGAEGAVSRDYGGSSSSTSQMKFGGDARKIATVEAFMGRQWRAGESNRTPASSTTGKVNRIYGDHLQRLYGGLMLQTHLKDLSAAVTISLKEGAESGSTDIGDYKMDLSRAKAILDGESNARRDEFLLAITVVYGESDFVLNAMKSADPLWAYDIDYLLADARGEVIRGTSRSDSLYGASGQSDIFDGDAGGADTLYGKGGDDVYWLGRGTGHDVVDEGYYSSGDTGDKIRVKSGVLRSSVDLLRSKDGADLYVRVLGTNGAATDSLRVKGYYTSAKAKVESVVFADGTVWGSLKLDAASYERYRGGAGGDNLYGNGRVNHFDGDAGGNDNLHGYGGDDVYWLGRGTGHDVVYEGYRNSGTGDAGDKIRVKSGVSVSSVDLLRSKDGADLYVRVLGTDGALTDSLRVNSYYTSAKSRVESVVFADGTVWGSSKLDAASYERYRGGAGGDNLYGNGRVNHFDGDAGGNDNLHGYGGDDVYWLGRGTGHDVVYEGYGNSGTGDAGDKIRVKSGVSVSSVELLRSKDGADLYVRVLGTDGALTDSLRVNSYYTSAKSRVESVVFADGTVWGSSKLDAASYERYRGGAGGDNLYGNGRVNHFDGDAGGNDNLHGYGGDDVYWLGRGTGHDVVYEGYQNTVAGDTGDEIRLKSGIVESDVRWERVGDHLYVRVLGSDGVATDSLKVSGYYASARARVERVVFGDGTVWGLAKMGVLRHRGGSGADVLHGNAGRADTFDGDAGGNDTLYGYSGDDVYWLGRGTGHDVVEEGYGNAGSGDTGDEVRVKSGIGASSVRLERDRKSLYIRLLGANGTVTDSLKVKDYYASAKSRVERVVFGDGTVWGSGKMDALRLHGTSGADVLHGNAGRADIFDGDAGGDDTLRGYSGDDVYWLGRGTGHDVVDEGYGNSGSGDAGDEIRVKSGIGTADVRMEREGDHLYVRVLGAGDAVTDSLKVTGYYASAKSKVERVVFADGTVWGSGKLDAVLDDSSEAFAARLRGTSRNDYVYGNAGRSDIFDADAGGNDELYGKGGDDVYWLGRGTGHDVVDEGYQNTGVGDTGDKIRVKAGIVPKSVDLLRSKDGADLYVRVLGTGDAVTDSLRVSGYYTSAKSRVESVVFADGTVWDGARLDAASYERYRGGAGGDNLYGNGRVNHFDGDAGGNDNLHGYGGDDVYWLGRGTGHDVVYEGYRNSGTGDAGDKIRVKSGVSVSSVELLRSKDGADLYVRVLGTNGALTDSLRVNSYYTSAKSRVESVVFADGTVWGSSKLDAASYERYRGGAGGDNLYGNGRVNHFDGDAGGNDNLHGYGGDDVYWLGRGTGHDVVYEGYGNSGTGDAGDKIRVKSGVSVSSVELLRSKDGADLYVRVLGTDGALTDSLRVNSYYTSAKSRVESVVFADGTVWGSSKLDAASYERYRGGAGGDNLYGNGRVNHFDGDAGGNDNLHGYGGDDVYWLGRGTGHDVVYEGYGNSGTGDAGDKIRVKSGVSVSSVELLRSKDGADLYVRVLGTNGALTDSLRVNSYYTSAKSRVESVVFADGTVWGSSKLDAASYERYRGGAGGDNLYGNGRVNHFDGDAGGNDNLHGYGGDDVYWLGRGTGHDVVYEGYGNSGTGDAGDEIRVKSGIGVADVRLRRVGGDLYVDALGASGTATDSLKVKGHYASEKSRVESIHAAGKVLLASQYLSLMHEMALFDAGNSQFSDMNSLLGRFWQDESALAGEVAS